MRNLNRTVGCIVGLVVGAALIYFGLVHGLEHHSITLNGKRGPFTLTGNQATAFGLFAILGGLFVVWWFWITQKKGVLERIPGTNQYRSDPASPGQVLAFTFAMIALVGMGVFIGYLALKPDEQPVSPQQDRMRIAKSAKAIWRVIEARARENPKHLVPAFDSDHMPAWTSNFDFSAELPDVTYRVPKKLVGARLERLGPETPLLDLAGPSVTNAFGGPWSMTPKSQSVLSGH